MEVAELLPLLTVFQACGLVLIFSVVCRYDQVTWKPVIPTILLCLAQQSTGKTTRKKKKILPSLTVMGRRCSFTVLMESWASWCFLLLSFRCFSEESCVSIPDVEGYVVVLQPDAPQILLSGTAHFAHTASDFEAPDGVPLFPNLQITCSISHQVEAKKDENWHGTGEWSMGRVREKMEKPASVAVLQRK